MIKPPLEVSSSSEDFFLIEGGKATGPFKGIEVWAKIQAGKINGNTPARTHSVATWMKLNHTSWEKYGIRVNDDFDQPDTASEKKPVPIQNESQKFRWRVKETKIKDMAMVSENLPLTVGQENLSNSEVSELSENQKYSLCLELGLWEKLLNDIKDQDFLDGLEDMNFLRAAIDRVEALSAKLIKNGVLNVSPNAYLSSEYDDFDNDAEKVEKMVLDLAKVIKSENFLEEFLNSSSKEDGLLKLEKIKTEVYMACVDFHKRNAHRIEIEGELKIWEFFAEKFGEDDDILLIQDLINIELRTIQMLCLQRTLPSCAKLAKPYFFLKTCLKLMELFDLTVIKFYLN